MTGHAVRERIPIVPAETGLRRRRSWVVLALTLLASRQALAEDRVLVQGLADAESWNTDAQSELLGRNDGRVASLERLRLWMAGQVGERIQGFALGEGVAGKAYEEGQTEFELEQAYLRYTAPPSLRLVVQAGKLTLPFGNFSRRYFSSANPLVGAPLNYQISYPLGLQVNGAVSRFDYMLAALDGPLTREEYLSNPTSSIRPAVAFGLTPLTGLRLGGYFTTGSYLSREETALLPPGRDWNRYHEEVVGFDLQFSRGHFELNGEHTRSRLEVPGSGSDRGWVAYLEPRYAWSPRWFTALRLERGRLLSVEPQAGTAWLAETERLYDLEAGVGFRIGPGLLVKASYRTDLAPNDPASAAEGGHAFALQLSYNFDVNSWCHPPR